jgi:hypothetical protein
MFKLFRRTPAPAAAQRKPAAPSARTLEVTRPLPLMPESAAMLEVTEDHDESAWDLWEQSQFQLDSQFGGLTPARSVWVKETTPSKVGDLDPFARIGKNHR